MVARSRCAAMATTVRRASDRQPGGSFSEGVRPAADGALGAAYRAGLSMVVACHTSHLSPFEGPACDKGFFTPWYWRRRFRAPMGVDQAAHRWPNAARLPRRAVPPLAGPVRKPGRATQRRGRRVRWLQLLMGDADVRQLRCAATSSGPRCFWWRRRRAGRSARRLPAQHGRAHRLSARPARADVQPLRYAPTRRCSAPAACARHAARHRGHAAGDGHRCAGVEHALEKPVAHLASADTSRTRASRSATCARAAARRGRARRLPGVASRVVVAQQAHDHLAAGALAGRPSRRASAWPRISSATWASTVSRCSGANDASIANWPPNSKRSALQAAW